MKFAGWVNHFRNMQLTTIAVHTRDVYAAPAEMPHKGYHISNLFVREYYWTAGIKHITLPNKTMLWAVDGFQQRKNCGTQRRWLFTPWDYYTYQICVLKYEHGVSAPKKVPQVFLWGQVCDTTWLNVKTSRQAPAPHGVDSYNDFQHTCPTVEDGNMAADVRTHGLFGLLQRGLTACHSLLRFPLTVDHRHQKHQWYQAQWHWSTKWECLVLWNAVAFHPGSCLLCIASMMTSQLLVDNPWCHLSTWQSPIPCCKQCPTCFLCTSCLPWPVCLSDLWPVENVWDINMTTESSGLISELKMHIEAQWNGSIVGGI